ncbi:MAG: type I-G CRISPR-associated protein Csb2 [Bacilli bacterium]
MVRESVRRIGLPYPTDVRLSNHSEFTGAASASAYRSGTHGNRPLVHAVLEFDAPIVGPLLVGRSRYAGMGLMRPWQGGGDHGLE